MDMKQFHNLCFEDDYRIGPIYWLAGLAHGTGDDDFIDDVIFPASEEETYCHGTMSRFRDLPEWALEDEGFAEWNATAEHFGFIVEVSIPVVKKFHDNGGWSDHHFGHSACVHIYVDRLEDLEAHAVKWREEMFAKWRAKLSAPAAE